MQQTKLEELKAKLANARAARPDLQRSVTEANQLHTDAWCRLEKCDRDIESIEREIISVVAGGPQPDSIEVNSRRTYAAVVKANEQANREVAESLGRGRRQGGGR
jgi:hypothetical protein